MELNLQLGVNTFSRRLGWPDEKNTSFELNDSTLSGANNTNCVDQSEEFFLRDNNTSTVSTNFEWWHAFETHYLRHSITRTAIIVLSYFVILVAGLVGNSLVILAYTLRPKMRSVTNLFIMNLALADLMAVLFCFLGNLLANTIKPWILGSFMCKAVAVVQGMSVTASAYFLAAIAVTRCKAVCRTLGLPLGLRSRQTTYAVLFIWLLAFGLSMPWAITLTVVNREGLSVCAEQWGRPIYGKIYFLFVNVSIDYMIPLFAIVTANIVIWYRIKHRPLTAESSSSIKQMHRRAKSEVRKMLGIVTIVFLVSWLPLHIMLILYRCFTLNEETRHLLHFLLPIGQWIGSSNSSINPIIYAFLNRNFREAFKSLLPCVRYFQRSKRARNHGPAAV